MRKGSPRVPNQIFFYTLCKGGGTNPMCKKTSDLVPVGFPERGMLQVEKVWDQITLIIEFLVHSEKCDWRTDQLTGDRGRCYTCFKHLEIKPVADFACFWLYLVWYHPPPPPPPPYIMFDTHTGNTGQHKSGKSIYPTNCVQTLLPFISHLTDMFWPKFFSFFLSACFCKKIRFTKSTKRMHENFVKNMKHWMAPLAN